MGPKKLFELQWKLDDMGRNARDIASILETEYPRFAAFFTKVANHSSRMASYIRTNDQMPPQPRNEKMDHAIGNLQLVDKLPSLVVRKLKG